MPCICELSVSEDKDPDFYNYLCTLTQPSDNIIPNLPCGFYYVKLISENGINVAKLMKKN